MSVVVISTLWVKGLHLTLCAGLAYLIILQTFLYIKQTV